MAKNVKVIDRGWKRIRMDMEELGRSGVKVGIRAGEGTGASKAVAAAAPKPARPARKKGRKGRRRRTMTTSDVQVVDYAVMNEFGTEHIPARPFMRKTADDNEGKIGEVAQRLVSGLVAGRRSVDDVLKSIAQWYQRAMKMTIKNSPSWAQPNAPATIEEKRSSQPLVDHGVLSGSIDYEKVWK